MDQNVQKKIISHIQSKKSKDFFIFGQKFQIRKADKNKFEKIYTLNQITLDKETSLNSKINEEKIYPLTVCINKSSESQINELENQFQDCIKGLQDIGNFETSFYNEGINQQLQKLQLQPYKFVSTPLSVFLAKKQQKSPKEMDNKNAQNEIYKFGFLTLDQNERIYPFMASDSYAKQVPLIGIWSYGLEMNIKEFDQKYIIWSLLVEFIKNQQIATRFSYDDIKKRFIYISFNAVQSPEFYEVEVKREDPNDYSQIIEPKWVLLSNNQKIKLNEINEHSEIDFIYNQNLEINNIDLIQSQQIKDIKKSNEKQNSQKQSSGKQQQEMQLFKKNSSKSSSGGEDQLEESVKSAAFGCNQAENSNQTFIEQNTNQQNSMHNLDDQEKQQIEHEISIISQKSQQVQQQNGNSGDRQDTYQSAAEVINQQKQNFKNMQNVNEDQWSFAQNDFNNFQFNAQDTFAQDKITTQDAQNQNINNNIMKENQNFQNTVHNSISNNNNNKIEEKDSDRKNNHKKTLKQREFQSNKKQKASSSDESDNSNKKTRQVTKNGIQSSDKKQEKDFIKKNLFDLENEETFTVDNKGLYKLTTDFLNSQRKDLLNSNQKKFLESKKKSNKGKQKYYNENVDYSNYSNNNQDKDKFGESQKEFGNSGYRIPQIKYNQISNFDSESEDEEVRNLEKRYITARKN
ncbi:hypothetical protein PPERSA_12105 [Pseudocohnilembus persalinus]|uniref:STIL N-terminal domain-containing protein n=1 Tax=Pseudocohnilembus persalinus TaxID=266149 RepID=A0A0V0QP03_PSEPJ|nr:hypothetical protein PPERSA_12105 [Pseudocohnilembus persalinus]|eukprot:KRX03900.1 hypothetical protein PPERSA_12105 [Pseudocohnilembus persalinus]